MINYFGAYLAQRHKKYSKKPMTIHVAPINQVQILGSIAKACLLLATIITDVVEYVKQCKACQIHVDFIH